jgi:hypothetical protein
MNVYLCGRYALRKQLRKCAVELEDAGHTCTSTWLHADGSLEVEAKQDVADILRSDVLIQFTDADVETSPHPHAARGGRHWEQGFAYARGLFCMIVGPRENIFHHLPEISVSDDWPQALAWVNETQAWLDLSDEDDVA